MYEQSQVSRLGFALGFGFGLRWAQMGLFETYRVAGGEAGMAHFIKQFGPCLKWPWTKLTHVPELTDEMVKMIANNTPASAPKTPRKKYSAIIIFHN